MSTDDFREFVITSNDGRQFFVTLSKRRAGITIGQSFIAAMGRIVRNGEELEGSWGSPHNQKCLTVFPSGAASIEMI